MCNSSLARTIQSNLYIGNTNRYPYLYLTRNTSGVGLGILHDFGKAVSGTDATVSKSQTALCEYSYSTGSTSSSGDGYTSNLLSYSENYYLPACNANLAASVAYYILTTKEYPSAISGRAVPSGATFDTMTTAGVYNIANNCSGYPTTSGTNYNYGILLVATTASPNGSQSNMF